MKERIVNLLNYPYLYKRSVNFSGAESLTNALEALGNLHLTGFLSGVESLAKQFSANKNLNFYP